MDAEALQSFQRSAVLHRRLGDRSREALAWHGTGRTYLGLDRRADAVAFHRREAAAHRELDDSWNEALALEHLGAALFPEAPAEAREQWSRALALIADFDDPRAVAARDRFARRLRTPS